MKFIILDSKDNCATALEDIPQSAIVQLPIKTIMINNPIPLGHKFATKKIKKGNFIFKYGEKIGISTEDIGQGDWIHTHNVTSSYLKVAKDG